MDTLALAFAHANIASDVADVSMNIYTNREDNENYRKLIDDVLERNYPENEHTADPCDGCSEPILYGAFHNEKYLCRACYGEIDEIGKPSLDDPCHLRIAKLPINFGKFVVECEGTLTYPQFCKFLEVMYRNETPIDTE